MTDDDKPIKKGRGFPPHEHKWLPGVSGNIFGRPLGSKNKKKRHQPGLTPSQQIAIEKAGRKVKTSDGEMEAVRAVMRSQVVSAIKGGSNAQRNALDRIDRIEARQPRLEARLGIRRRLREGDVVDAAARDGG